MKIISLIGARPQFIKEAVVNSEFKKRKNVKEIIVNSGQHYDFNMADIFFDVLNISKPDYNLNIGSGNHGEMTGKIMIEFEKIVLKEAPNAIIVYGDTNTTLAGAIVSSKLKIPIYHIEAGIRMFPKNMPEEINRVLTDRISDKLFCPSNLAVENLKKEGIINGVYFTGDVMFDLFLKMEKDFRYDFFKNLNLKEKEYVLLTLHRDYNVDNEDRLFQILQNISKIKERVKVVFPIHPRTKKMINKFGLEKFLEDIIVTEPTDYLNLMGLVKMSKKVISDSGGVQKEAYFAKKRCGIISIDTGWQEIVDIGWNRLLDPGDIEEFILSEEQNDYIEKLYGNGKAGEKIANIICQNLGEN